MSELTDYSAVEQEPPEIRASNLRVGAQIWSSATFFFFVAFLFAYFYLRSLNEEHGWKPKGVDAPVGWGTAGMLCVVAAALLVAWRRPAWRLRGTAALVLGLAAVVLQIVTYTQIGFGPTNGGFASVYLGWTGFYALFVLGTMFWLETIVAVSFRHASADAETSELAALTSYLFVLAGIGVVTWIVLYLL